MSREPAVSQCEPTQARFCECKGEWAYEYSAERTLHPRSMCKLRCNCVGVALWVWQCVTLRATMLLMVISVALLYGWMKRVRLR